jgi:hypothetical protein
MAQTTPQRHNRRLPDKPAETPHIAYAVYRFSTYYANHGILLQNQVSEQIPQLILNNKLSTVDNQLSIKKRAYTKLV